MSGQKGQTLIELLLAMGLLAMVIPALFSAVYSARAGRGQETRRVMASLLLKETNEAIRSVKDRSWVEFADNGTFHPQIINGDWALVAGANAVGDYYVQAVISDVARDENGALVDSGGKIDRSSKKVVIAVTWEKPLPGIVESTNYFQRVANNVGLIHTTKQDFDGGSHLNTLSTNNGGGAVELASNFGSQSLIEDYSNPDDYTFDPSAVEVTGGFAQLKNIGNPVSGSTTNPGFNTNTQGWSSSTYFKNVKQTFTRKSGNGSPGGYVDINFPVEKNARAGGYWYQSFTTTAENPLANVSFSYKVFKYNPTPISFHAYVFVENHAFAPSTAPLWDSGNIVKTSDWLNVNQLAVSSALSAPGTYYLKIAVEVEYPSVKRGPYNVGFDNVLLTWSGIDNRYSTSRPSINAKNSFKPVVVQSWDSFTEVAAVNGGSIRYQLSDDDGLTWKYFTGGSWVTASGPSQSEVATTVDRRINLFPTSSKKINVRAFLISDGSQLVKLDRLVIGFTGLISPNTGVFTSGSFDTGANFAFNSIKLSASTPPGTSYKYQVAVNDDNLSWDYAGPDGTGNTYFTSSESPIPPEVINGRYLRYEITLDSDSTNTPVVYDVTINASP